MRRVAGKQRKPGTDPITDVQYALGFEYLRHILQAEAAARGSVAALADEIGIPAAPLRRFLTGGEPNRRLWTVLTDYVAESEAEKPIASAGVVGLGVAVSALSEPHRRDARIHLANALVTFLQLRGERVPRWIPDSIRLWSI
jgi:hypothetical protein